MADFYEVHRKAIEAAKDRVRYGEIWNVAVREPFPIFTAPTEAVPGISVTILMFRAASDGRLVPARDFDHQKIADWNARHRHTSPESFGLPARLIGAGQPTGEPR